MALIRADRVKESSTSTSTSAFLLNGADSTYRTFASVCAVGDTVYYAIAHRTANEWEVGLGTYSATNTLTRTTVHASSNANAAVTFSAGTKDVLLALTKTQLETYATLAGTETLTNKTINASSNTVTNVSLTTGVTGTLPLGNGGTGTTTAQLAMNALAGAVTSGSYLRGNGTNVVMAAIQAADVPTLNQNTTGTASGSVSGTASYVPKFTSTNVVGNSQIVDNATGVGIGLAPTVAKFEVNAPENTDAFALAGWKLLKWDTTSQITFGGYTAGQWQVLKFFTAGSEKVRIDASGNVGIGTSAPTHSIVIAKNGPTPAINIYKSPDGVLRSAQQVVSLGTGASVNNSGTTGGNEYGILQLYISGVARCQLYAYAGGGGYNSYVLDGMSFGQTSAAAGQVVVAPVSAATKGLIVKGFTSQSANLQEWQNNAGLVLSAVKSDGSIQPASMADSAATNNSIYYSTTASKLVYKDSAGTVNNLY